MGEKAVFEFSLGQHFLVAPWNAVKNPQNSLSQELIIHSRLRPDDLWHMVGVLFAFLKSPRACSGTNVIWVRERRIRGAVQSFVFLLPLTSWEVGDIGRVMDSELKQVGHLRLWLSWGAE